MKHKILTLLLVLAASIGSLRAQITIDGNFSDWDQVPAAQLAESSSSTSDYLFNVKFCTDAEYIYYYIEFGELFSFNIYMNTDGNESTGYISGVGADYTVEGGIDQGESQVSIFRFNSSDQEAWDAWEDITSSAEMSICNPVVLGGGHSAFEGSLLIESIPTEITSLQVRVLANWESENGIPGEGVLDVPFGTAEIPTSGTCGENLTWELSEGVLAISGTGAMTSNPWRPSRNDIQTISMGDGITVIKDAAFADCKNLTTVNIPSTVTSIGDDAFKGCSSLPIIDNIRYADTYLVQVLNNSLSSYTIQPGTKWIGSNAFNGCNLLSITIPNDIIGIGSNAFAGIMNVNYNGSATGTPWGAIVHNGYVEGWLVYSDDSKEELILCSSDAEGEIVLPDGLLTIDENAFAYCTGITAINIPSSVTSIGEGAFGGCTGLPVVDNIRYADTYLIEAVDKEATSYTIQSGTKWIANDAFAYCSAPSISIPDEVAVIGDWAFSGVLNVIYHGSATGAPWGATMLNGYVDGWLAYSSSDKTALIKCSQDAEGEIVLPDGLLSIADEAFSGCMSITGINIPSTVTSIGSYAFRYCYSLPVAENQLRYADTYLIEALDQDATSYVIKDGTKWIGDGAFNMWFDNMKSVSIPNSVIRIGEYAFFSCEQLRKITIPANVASIGAAAFADCKNLSSISCEALTPPVLYEGYTAVFAGVNKSIPVYVPEASITAYQAADGWKDFTNIKKNVFTVTFRDWDEDVISVQNVKPGNNAVAPSDPTREGYTFEGWDKDFTDINDDMIITAQYSINQYMVTFNDRDNNFLALDVVDWHGAATAPDAPVIAGYTFTGWDKPIDDVTSDLTVKAQYTINQYTVIFLDWDDSELKQETVDWQGAATAPDAPVHEGYNFAGWDTYDFYSVTSNLTVKAQYSLKIHDVFFVDYDGTLLRQTSVTHGSTAIPPVSPSRDGYTFTGWSGEYENVTDRTFSVAQYEPIPTYTHTVVYKDKAGEILSSEDITLSVPTAPVIEGFTFLKWVATSDDIDNGIIIQAVYQADTPTEVPATYTNPANPAQKLIRNGNVYILTEDKTYTITGQAVK